MGTTSRVLIFDADGVLIEPWGFANVLESEYRIARSSTREFFEGPFQECLAGHSDLYDQLPPYLERWAWKGSTSDFVRLWFAEDDRPSVPAFEAIQCIRQVGDTCCIASNQERYRARYLAHSMGFAKRFDRLYFSCDLGAVKPEPEYYRAIEQDLGRRPEQLYFWDDSAEHVDAAARRGWNAYVYDGPESIARAV
jgi:putative hydrolase of the HAD superfamily